MSCVRQIIGETLRNDLLNNGRNANHNYTICSSGGLEIQILQGNFKICLL